MSNRIPTIAKIAKIEDDETRDETRDGTRYETLTEAMRENGFNQSNDRARFGCEHRKIKKPLKEEGTATYKNNDGHDVTFTLGN